MIKIGMIGVGYWGPNLLRNFSNIPEVKIEWIVDKDPKRLEEVKRKYDAKLTEDPLEVFKSSVDAVVIATPAVTHYELTKRALECDKDVFVEKPICIRSEEIERIKEIVEKRKRILMVGHLLLYHPSVNYIKKMIEDNELGEIYYVDSARLNLGKIRKDENALWSLAPHDVSMIIYLLGEIPEAVSSTGQSFLQKGIEDLVFITLYFKEKRIAHVTVSWLHPHKIRKTTVVGSSKMVVFDDTEPSEKIKIYDRDITPDEIKNGSFVIRYGDIVVPKVSLEEPLKRECMHFVECIKKRTTPLTDINNGLNVVKILEAAQKSINKKGGIEKI